MALVTRAELEALRGPQYLANLLSVARQASSSSAEQLEQEQARLDTAIAAGEDLIAQFFPREFTESAGDHLRTFKRFALDEAFYYLHLHSQSHASEAMDAAATQRRADLAHMRKRVQMPGTTEVGSAPASYAESESSYSRKGLRGFY